MNKKKSKQKRRIEQNERKHRDLYLKSYKNRVISKKYVKCSFCGKNISNSLRFFLAGKNVCEECFIYHAKKVKNGKQI